VIETGESQDEPLKLRNTVSATNLSDAVKQITIPSRMGDDGRSVPASPVFPVDPQQNPIQNVMPTVLYQRGDPPAVIPLQPFTGNGNGLQVAAQMMFQNVTGGYNEVERTPNTFKNVLAVNAGSTAVWTAGVGKRWRLMGLVITLGQGTTAAAGVKVSLFDVAADTGIGVTVSSGALAAAPNEAIILSMDIKNGLMAAATNTALNVNLSSAMAVNGVSVQVWGTEE
jgi:hypothetical protein